MIKLFNQIENLKFNQSHISNSKIPIYNIPHINQNLEKKSIT